MAEIGIYARAGVDGIHEATADTNCGWIVDVRGNQGGGSWPMLAALDLYNTLALTRFSSPDYEYLGNELARYGLAVIWLLGPLGPYLREAPRTRPGRTRTSGVGPRGRRRRRTHERDGGPCSGQVPRDSPAEEEVGFAQG